MSLLNQRSHRLAPSLLQRRRRVRHVCASDLHSTRVWWRGLFLAVSSHAKCVGNEYTIQYTAGTVRDYEQGGRAGSAICRRGCSISRGDRDGAYVGDAELDRRSRGDYVCTSVHVHLCTCVHILVCTSVHGWVSVHFVCTFNHVVSHSRCPGPLLTTAGMRTLLCTTYRVHQVASEMAEVMYKVVMYTVVMYKVYTRSLL